MSSTDPDTFPSAFPRLYPYGIGGARSFKSSSTSATDDDVPSARNASVSLRAYAQSLLLRSGQDYACHPHFIFFAFDMLQRAEVSARATIRMRWPSASRMAARLSALTLDDLTRMADDAEAGRPLHLNPALTDLLSAMKFITGALVGSAQSRSNSRSDLKALITAFGTPAVWFTVAPPDTDSALVVKFADDSKIDLDRVLSLGLPNRLERRRMVAANPVAAARYFKVVMDAVWDLLIRPDRAGEKVGIFGKVLTHYGTIESQGRGSLHTHALIWVHGQPSPSEMQARLRDASLTEWRQRLISKLDVMLRADFDGIFDQAAAARADGRDATGLVAEDVHPSIRPPVALDGSPEEWDRANEIRRKEVRLPCGFVL